MSRKSHHRSRSSIDRVLDLLAELDEDQMEALLREAESTVSGNIQVSKGIDFFERPGPVHTQAQPPLSPPPRRKFLTSLSPKKQTELKRRLSKRASTHQPPSLDGLGNPDSRQGHKKTPRSYKRISRPTFSLPTHTDPADLAELLLAYLLDASVTLPSPRSPPAAPQSLSSSRPFSPCAQLENEGPGLDLLEPPPRGAPKTLDIFSGPVRGPVRKISGIFEILDDSVTLTQDR
ncbi:hypothetical protein SAMD00023353_0900980 [Rosellinia necatrix]|uniref:Uncharacterized protein n=1 Tax=Rosellinia necatrix TaxID=77044 RepID=A0A1W2THL8_ROSNE|nr:hypothetical protein SAMD00023353_0900980 [Rosellinia necatrix]